MNKSLELFQEGKSFFAQRKYEEAEKCFLALLKGRKPFADVYNMLGVIYHQTGQFSDAIDHFKKAIHVNPHYAEALLNLSVLYNDLGEYRKAAQLYKKVYGTSQKPLDEKVNPLVKNKLANQYAELGKLYEGVGLYPEAIEAYEKAIEWRPNFLDIRTKLAICLREENRPQEAVEVLKAILEQNKEYLVAKIELGITYYAMGERQKGLQIWKNILKKDPKNPKANLYLKLVEEEKQALKKKKA